MDAAYLDPSRSPRRTAGVFILTARLLGLVVFTTGIVLGCYAGLHWFRTGQFGAALIEDVVVAKLPNDARLWIGHPRSWYGLHRFVMWVLRIPLFALLAFTGFLILLATATDPGKRRK